MVERDITGIFEKAKQNEATNIVACEFQTNRFSKTLNKEVCQSIFSACAVT